MADVPTTVANLVTLYPEVVEQGVLPTASRMQVIGPVIRTPRSFKDVTGPGDLFRIEQADTLTFGALSVDGATANEREAWIPTERTLTPVLIGTQLSIPYMGSANAAEDPVVLLQEEIANAWATLNDSHTTLGFAQAWNEAPSSGPDHIIGTDAVAMDHTIARQIFQLLITAGAKGPYNWFIDPITWAELLSDATSQALLRDSGGALPGSRATEGLRMDMYAGRMFGLDIWCVPTGLHESSGLHTFALGQNAMGMRWKNISTPLSPSSSQVNVDIDWDTQLRNFLVAITVCQDIGGIAFTSSTNKWVVNAIS